MSDRVALLCNPAAGRGQAAAESTARFRAVFGPRAPVLATTAPHSDARSLHAALRALPAHAVVVVAGGDGTLHAAVNALAGAFGAEPWPRLAHLPTGSANDGARAIAALTGRRHGRDVESELAAIAARVAGDHPGVPADLGSVCGADGARRLFANFAAAGSPADWAELSARPWAQAVKRLSVRAAYGLCNLCVIARRRIHHLAIGLEGEAATPRRTFAWFAAKARFLGGGLDLGPSVRLDSGALHVVAIDAAPRRALVQLLQRAKRGDAPPPVAARGARLGMAPPVRLNLDGEIVDFGATPWVELTVLPQRVRWL